ncbi:MAG: SMC-Scp complex subunit ScpB [Bdellovibrionales bacterium]|nr:SMC-Scp complex subunit ScpB [Bdellovibrionales bacterium]
MVSDEKVEESAEELRDEQTADAHDREEPCESDGVESEELEESSEDDELSFDDRAALLESFSEVDRQALVEALLFASGEPLGEKKISDVTGIERAQVVDILDSLKMKLSLEESGVELFESNNRYQLRTKPQFAHFIQQLRASRPKRLSQQALETLAIVAYRQPIVRSDVEKIRGVDATPTLKTLIDRGFIRIVGHQESIGQPALYGTTPQFLEVFGLSTLGELPTLRDLQQLEAHADESSNEDEIVEEDDEVVELEENIETEDVVQAEVAANS